MSLQPLSLIHRIEKSAVDSSNPPPLLLLLHGLGSNEDDLMGLVSQLDKRFFIVSARAPIPLSPGSYGWFRVNFTQTGPIINPTDAESSRLSLLHFIDELVEAYALNSKRVYLMGFSQGAIMAFSLALTQPNKVAGVVAMSGRILPEVLPQMDEPKALTGLPIFMTHGTADTVLPIHHGRNSRDFLETLPVTLTYREYPMGHQVSQESLKDIDVWLAKQLDLGEPIHPPSLIG
jgi:phospholipase/carboxylesterase